MSQMAVASDLRVLDVLIDEKCYLPENPVFRNFELTVGRREFVSVLGPSGCGKTTLLRMIAGLDTNYTGRVIHNGERVVCPDPSRGIVFQEARLLPWLTAEQNVSFAVPRRISGLQRLHNARLSLTKAGMANCFHLLPCQMSGGMKKRVALARALVNLPSLLLMDEPFVGVDPFVRFALQDSVEQINEDYEFSTVLVTHDVDDAVFLSDRIIVLSNHPTSIIQDVSVDLPRPRERTSQAMAELSNFILKHLLASHIHAN